jgi:hypothetical protein
MNEQTDNSVQLMEQPITRQGVQPAAPTLEVRPNTAISPQAGCATCGGAAGMPAKPSFVYAIGQVEARFPNLAVEKEFAQATGRSDTAGKTDQQTFHAVLSMREHRYLVRQLCWVLTIQGLDTYLLVPRDSAEIDLLVEAIRPVPSPNDVDVVIGVRGPIAPPQRCAMV